jgi:hypothetical protein
MGKTIYITENQLDYIIKNVDLLTEQTGNQYCKVLKDNKKMIFYQCEMQSPYPDNVIVPFDDHGNLKPEVTSFLTELKKYVGEGFNQVFASVQSSSSSPTATKCLQQDSEADYFKDEFKHDFGEGVTKDQWLASQNGACKAKESQVMPNGNTFLAKARQSNMMGILKENLGVNVAAMKVKVGGDDKVSKVVVKLVKKETPKEKIDKLGWEFFTVNRMFDGGSLNFVRYDASMKPSKFGNNSNAFASQMVKDGLIKGCDEYRVDAETMKKVGMDQTGKVHFDLPCDGSGFKPLDASFVLNDMFKGLKKSDGVIKGKRLYDLLQKNEYFKGKVRDKAPVNTTLVQKGGI